MLHDKREENIERRKLHHRQMSSVQLQKEEYITSVKKEALELRKENNRLIEANREIEYQKNKDIRNKIHKP